LRPVAPEFLKYVHANGMADATLNLSPLVGLDVDELEDVVGGFAAALDEVEDALFCEAVEGGVVAFTALTGLLVEDLALDGPDIASGETLGEGEGELVASPLVAEEGLDVPDEVTGARLDAFLVQGGLHLLLMVADEFLADIGGRLLERLAEVIAGLGEGAEGLAIVDIDLATPFLKGHVAEVVLAEVVIEIREDIEVVVVEIHWWSSGIGAQRSGPSLRGGLSTCGRKGTIPWFTTNCGGEMVTGVRATFPQRIPEL